MEQKTPDAFKALILSKHPDGVSADGRRYADIPAQELTQKIVSKYPKGTTAAGVPYSAYLNQKPAINPTKGSSTGIFTGPLSLLATLPQLGIKTALEFGTRKSRDILTKRSVAASEQANKLTDQAMALPVNDPNRTKLLQQAMELNKIGQESAATTNDINTDINTAQRVETPVGTIPALANTPGRVAQQVLGRGAQTTALMGGGGAALSGASFGLGQGMEAGDSAGVIAAKTAGGYAVGGILGAGLGLASQTGLGNKILTSKASQVIGKLLAPLSATPTAGVSGTVLGGREASQAVDVFSSKANAFANAPFKAVENKATQALSEYRAKVAEEAKRQVDDLAQQIAQGNQKDITRVKRALSDIDVTDVKTYKDLTETFNAKIEGVSSGLDDVLGTNTEVKKLSQLKLQSTVGGEKVTHNYVDDALNQLDDFYQKTGNQSGIASIKQLKKLAQTDGLRVRDINDLAKLHGRELSAFNANGEAASGLTKQAAENTRMGVKNTAKGIFKNPVYDQADKEMSALIRARNLSQRMEGEVQKLRGRIQKRGWGEKVGRLVYNAFDLATGNSLSGFLRAGFVPRGGGLKTLNALDLEQTLAKNLKEVQRLLDNGATEQSVISKLESIIASQTQLSNALPISQSTNNIVNTVPKNPITISIQELPPEVQRILKMKGAKATTPLETAVAQIKQSGAFPIEKSIANGDIPRSSVFKGKGDTLTVPFAQGRIDDVAQKLDMHKPGLGDTYRASVNVNNVTMAEIIQKGLDFLK